MTLKGDAINHCEMFDETDLDAALARFDELSREGTAVGKRGKPNIWTHVDVFRGPRLGCPGRDAGRPMWSITIVAES